MIACCKRPKCFWKCLHRRCKPQKPLFTSCTTGANRKNYYLALAPSVQIEKAAFEPLHRWCKLQKPLFTSCTTGASHKKYFLVVAPLVQAFPKTFWPSRDSRRNSLLALFSRRTHSKRKGRPTFMETPPLKIGRLRLRYFR